MPIGQGSKHGNVCLKFLPPFFLTRRYDDDGHI